MHSGAGWGGGEDEVLKPQGEGVIVKAKRKSTAAGKSEKQKIVAEALQTTWLLKGRLKSAQLAYLKIGELLIKVRDLKLDVALAHPTLEDYAEKRLKLGKSSLYRYIRVYEWVRASHPQWLADKPKDFIPELDDVAGLMWIDRELARTDLPEQERKALTALQAKGLAGELRQRDLAPWRGHGKTTESLATYLAQLTSLRHRGEGVKGLPPEVAKCLDEAIAILNSHKQLAAAAV